MYHKNSGVVFLSDFRKFCLIIAYKAEFFKVGRMKIKKPLLTAAYRQ